jgi:hypothetical protein
VTITPERSVAQTHAARPRRTVLHTLRPARRVPAVLVALVLLAAGALTVWEIVLARANRPPFLLPREQLAVEITGVSWNDPAVLTGGVVVALLGVLLLGLALWPGRAPAFVLDSGDPDVLIAVGRRSLRQLLARDARRHVGVARARVSVRRRRVAVRVRGQSTQPAETRTEIQQALERRLADVQPLGGAHPAVRVRWRKQRR